MTLRSDRSSSSALLPEALGQPIQRWYEKEGKRQGVKAIILFGSRAKRLARRSSDWDMAIVHAPGRKVSLAGLPRLHDGCEVNWICFSDQRLESRRHLGGTVESAAAEQGVLACGRVRLGTGVLRMTVAMAMDRLGKCFNKLDLGARCLADYYFYFQELGFSNNLCAASCEAAEFLAKSITHLRGFNPQKTHIVSDLCDELEELNPADALLPSLRKLNGNTHRGHVDGWYRETDDPVESFADSEQRLMRTASVAVSVMREVESEYRRDPAVRTECDPKLGSLAAALGRPTWDNAFLYLMNAGCPEQTVRDLERKVNTARESIKHLRNLRDRDSG